MTRNLAQYPITDEERKETLKQIQLDILGDDPTDPPIGDLRAEILQEAIDAIDEKNVTMCIAGDDALKEKIERLEKYISEQQYNSRAQLITDLKRAGFEPGMWTKWRNDPPPLEVKQIKSYYFDEILYAVIDALTQEGVTAWAGDATSCVSQMIYAQMNHRRKLFNALKAIASTETDDAEELRSVANEAITEVL